MELSRNLLKQFAGLTNDGSRSTKESTSYGTIVEDGGKVYVQLDGADRLTPMNTTADVSSGDRVLVSIKNHSATVIGNTTSPSAKSSTVKGLSTTVDSLGTHVNEMKVGGRNLALKTANPYTITGTNVSNQTAVLYYMSVNWNSLIGSPVTISFDYKFSEDAVRNGTGKTTGSVGMTATPWTRWADIPLPTEGLTGHVSATYTIPSTMASSWGIGLRLDYFEGTITISNFKMEKGNMATDWTPAPEDTANSVSEIQHWANNIKLVVTGPDGTSTSISITDDGEINLSGSVIANRIFTELLMAQDLVATGSFQINTDKLKLLADENGLKFGIDMNEANTDYSLIEMAKGVLSLLAHNIEISGDTIMLSAGTAININGDTLNDFIVDQGTSGVWTYEKWSSGRAKLWGNIPVTNLAVNTAFSDWFRSGSAFSRSGNAFPFSFALVPSVQANYFTTDGYPAMVWWVGTPTVSQLGQCYLIRNTSATTNGFISVTVDGFWE